LFSKPSAEDIGWQGPQRVHVEQPAARELFRHQIGQVLRQLYEPSRRLAILCIGTDRSTGDCLGPLIGTRLAGTIEPDAVILGTLDRPVHAVNLEEAMDSLRSLAPDPFIIAVDACLGRSESVGYISLKEGPLQPGTGVNKSLPPVGDFHIVGIVNVGGFMEYLVLQNTRLSLVMHMAEIIADGLRHGVRSIMGPGSLTQPSSLAGAEAAVSQPGV